MDRKQVSDLNAKVAAARTQQGIPAHATSAAKHIDPDGLKGTSLENAPDMKQQFDRAHDNTKSQDTNEIKQASGSSMANTPQMNLNPPPSMRNGTDREAHAQQLSAEQKRAMDAFDAQKARQAQQDHEKMNDGKDHD